MRLWHSELALHHIGYRPTFYTPRWTAHSHGMVKVFVKCQQMMLVGQYFCFFTPSTKAFIFSFQVTGDASTGPKVCLLRLSDLTGRGAVLGTNFFQLSVPVWRPASPSLQLQAGGSLMRFHGSSQLYMSHWMHPCLSAIDWQTKKSINLVIFTWTPPHLALPSLAFLDGYLNVCKVASAASVVAVAVVVVVLLEIIAFSFVAPLLRRCCFCYTSFSPISHLLVGCYRARLLFIITIIIIICRFKRVQVTFVAVSPNGKVSCA